MEISIVKDFRLSYAFSLKQTAQRQKQQQIKKILQKLRVTDMKVRAHEMAHLKAAQGVAISGPNYEYVRGPDGKMYAIGGEVNIDTTPIPGNPKATAEKAEKIKRAALAPSDPSPQDYRVAQQAEMMKQRALSELHHEENLIDIII